VTKGDRETAFLHLGQVAYSIINVMQKTTHIPFKYDNDAFLLILPGADLNSAFNLGAKINSSFGKQQDTVLVLGLFQYQNAWGTEKCLKILEKLIATIALQSQSQIIYLDHVHGVFKSRKIT
jgi:hypothetical protein